MSTEDVKKIRSAYERMLKDGTAFREVDMSMMTEPDVSMAQGNTLGDRIEETAQARHGVDAPPEEYDHHTDYTEHDSYIQQRINRLRSKINGGKVNESGSSNMAKEVMSLKKRVKDLEEALMLVMDTHEKLLG